MTIFNKYCIINLKSFPSKEMAYIAIYCRETVVRYAKRFFPKHSTTYACLPYTFERQFKITCSFA